MSEGMLGRLPLSVVRGPRDTLDQRLAGGNGENWLKALNRFLRGDNPWPIVSRVIDAGKISVGDGLTFDDLLTESRFYWIEENAKEIFRSSKASLEIEPKTHNLVILEFDPDEVKEKGLCFQNVLSEIRRLKLVPPSFEDVLRLQWHYIPSIPTWRNDFVVFPHQPVRIRPYIGPGGMAINPDEEGMTTFVLSLSFDKGLRVADVDFLGRHTKFFARRPC